MSKKKLGLVGTILGILAIVCDLASESINDKMTEQMIDDKIDQRVNLLLNEPEKVKKED